MSLLAENAFSSLAVGQKKHGTKVSPGPVSLRPVEGALVREAGFSPV